MGGGEGAEVGGIGIPEEKQSVVECGQGRGAFADVVFGAASLLAEGIDMEDLAHGERRSMGRAAPLQRNSDIAGKREMP